MALRSDGNSTRPMRPFVEYKFQSRKTAHMRGFFVDRIGGAEGDRTLDLCIANAALSQLSYRPTFCTHRNGQAARREPPMVAAVALRAKPGSGQQRCEFGLQHGVAPALQRIGPRPRHHVFLQKAARAQQAGGQVEARRDRIDRSFIAATTSLARPAGAARIGSVCRVSSSQTGDCNRSSNSARSGERNARRPRVRSNSAFADGWRMPMPATRPSHRPAARGADDRAYARCLRASAAIAATMPGAAAAMPPASRNARCGCGSPRRDGRLAARRAQSSACHAIRPRCAELSAQQRVQCMQVRHVLLGVRNLRCRSAAGCSQSERVSSLAISTPSSAPTRLR